MQTGARLPSYSLFAALLAFVAWPYYRIYQIDDVLGYDDPEALAPLVDLEAVRAQADLENQRRRHEMDLDKARKFALTGFVEALLPVVDSMELGLAAAGDAADVAALREGSELTLKLSLEITFHSFGTSLLWC